MFFWRKRFKQKKFHNEKLPSKVINNSNLVNDFVTDESFLEITPLDFDIIIIHRKICHQFHYWILIYLKLFI